MEVLFAYFLFQEKVSGGDNRARTDDPLLAKQVLSQLSYTPVAISLSKVRNRPQKLNNECNLGLTALRRPDLGMFEQILFCSGLHRKEVIQPHLPIRLPCYDFTPIANPTFGSSLLAVRILTSGITGSHGVTGGVYKARERIHRGMLIRDY